MDKSLRIYLKMKDIDEKIKKNKDKHFNFFHFLMLLSLIFLGYSVFINSAWLSVISLNIAFAINLVFCFSSASFLSTKNEIKKSTLFNKKEKLKKEYDLYVENNHKQIILGLMNAKKDGKLKTLPIEYIRGITNYHESVQIFDVPNDMKIKLTEAQFNNDNMVNQ